MIRLFIGLELPEDIKQHIYSLRGGVAGARWIEPANLHLDLRFIGDVENPEASDIYAALSQVRFPAFDLSFKEIGSFYTGHEPRDLWVNVSDFQNLIALRNKIEGALYRFDVPPDKHKFHAHVRIAKLFGANMNEVQDYIVHNNLFHTKEYRVEYFTLFSTNHKGAGVGSYYKAEGRYALTL